MELSSLCTTCQLAQCQVVSCELCAQMVCEQCREAVRLYSVNAQELCQVCRNCRERVKWLESILETEQLVWCRFSPRGKRWFEACGALQLSMSTTDTIETYSSLSPEAADIDMINKDVAYGRTDPTTFHWEYSEILHRITPFSTSKSTYRDPIMRVLKAVCCRNRETGYCQGINYVVVWLLMFMEENAAFWVMSKVISEILTPGFYRGDHTGNSLNGFYIESGVIASFLETFYPSYKRSNLPSLEFSDFFSLQLLIQLFVDTIDFSSCIYLWDMFTSEGGIALIRGSLSLIHLLSDEITTGEHPITILKRLPSKHFRVHLPSVYDTVSVQATQARIDRLRSQIRDFRATQWRNSRGNILKDIERASHFTREEILLFQDAFNELIHKKVKKGVKRMDTSRGFSHQSVKIPIGLEVTETPELGISKIEFLTLVERFCPNLSDLAGDLFDRYDEDKSGYLDFRELMVCISLLSKGSFEEKLRVCYDLYDYDHSGYLSSLELDGLVDSLSRHLKTVNASGSVTQALAPVRDQLRRLLETDGMVAWKEFYQCIIQDRVLFDVFDAHLQTAGRYSTERVVRAVRGEPVTQKKCWNCRLW